MLRITSLIFTILLIYISLYFVTIRLDMHYKYINRDLVGMELDNIKSILGRKDLLAFHIKAMKVDVGEAIH